METRLSRNEKRLYGLITRDPRVRRGGRVSTDALTKKFYNNTVPINGRVYIANLIRSLKRKAPLLPGMRGIESTVGSGRGGNEVWLAPAREDAA
jgi:hypothetical protein